MRRELLTPANANRNCLGCHAVDQMHPVSLTDALRYVILDPFGTNRVDDPPKESTIRPSLEVELLVRQVSDDQRIITHQRPGPLYGILGQVLANPTALTHLIASVSFLRLLQDRLQESHASVLGLGQPDVNCLGQASRDLRRSVMYWWRSHLLRSFRTSASLEKRSAIKS